MQAPSSPAPTVEKLLCLALINRSRPQDWVALPLQDWQALVAAAQREGVAPLLYWSVKDHPESFPGMPPACLEKLHAEYYAVLGRNTLLFSTLWRVLPGLRQQGIPVLLLKGASLAYAVYGNLGLRPMGDVDMLFHREDVPAAAQVLQQAGLTSFVMEDEAHPENLGIYARPFVGEYPAMHVELHWNLFGKATNRYEPDLDWFWAHTQPYTLPPGAGIDIGDVRVLQPSLNFLYLCAHLAIKHQKAGERLLWYMDLFYLQANHRLDWDWIAETAARWHWSAGLYTCLEKLVGDFLIELPPDYLERLRYAISDVDWRYLQILSLKKNNWLSLYKALAPLRFLDRLRFILRAAFPSPDYMRWRYNPTPRWLWPLTYPLRWLRALQKLWKELRHPQRPAG